MEEIGAYYTEKPKKYDESLSMLYFRVFDAITWRYLEPYLPVNPEALVLDAGGGAGRWTIRMAKKARKARWLVPKVVKNGLNSPSVI
jgi:ubiquinone/menaquinone biosynthesis C-methylase UbiE